MTMMMDGCLVRLFLFKLLELTLASFHLSIEKPKACAEAALSLLNCIEQSKCVIVEKKSVYECLRTTRFGNNNNDNNDSNNDTFNNNNFTTTSTITADTDRRKGGGGGVVGDESEDQDQEELCKAQRNAYYLCKHSQLNMRTRIRGTRAY